MDRKTKQARHTLTVLPCFAIAVTAVVHAGSCLAIIPVCIVRCWTRSHSPFQGWTQNMYECFFVCFLFILLLLFVLFFVCLFIGRFRPSFLFLECQTSLQTERYKTSCWTVHWAQSLSASRRHGRFQTPHFSSATTKIWLQSWLSFLPHQKQSWLQKETNKQNPDNSLKNSQSLVFTAAASAYSPFARIFLSWGDCVCLTGRQNSGSD